MLGFQCACTRNEQYCLEVLWIWKLQVSCHVVHKSAFVEILPTFACLLLSASFPIKVHLQLIF